MLPKPLVSTISSGLENEIKEIEGRKQIRDLKIFTTLCTASKKPIPLRWPSGQRAGLPSNPEVLVQYH